MRHSNSHGLQEHLFVVLRWQIAQEELQEQDRVTKMLAPSDDGGSSGTQDAKIGVILGLYWGYIRVLFGLS